MSKSIQLMVSKQEIDDCVKKYINRKIQDICKKQGTDAQIEFEVDQAVIEVKLPNYEDRIKKLEDAVYGGKSKV